MEHLDNIGMALSAMVAIVVIFAMAFGLAFIIRGVSLILKDKREALSQERHDKHQFYDSVRRIARSCERIEDVLTRTEILSTVEVTEEIKYDGRKRWEEYYG